MDQVSFKYDKLSSLPGVQKVNGRWHAVVDNGELYLDYENNRVKITDIEVHATESEREALLAPKPKFHYCKDSGNLWYKNGAWKLVGQQGATKTEVMSLDTASASSTITLQAGWLVKRVTFVPDEAYNEGAVITVSVGSQSLIPTNDLIPSGIADQYDSLKITKLSNAGKVDVDISGATSGSGTLYVEYTIL